MIKRSLVVGVFAISSLSVCAQTQKGQTIIGEAPGDESGSFISMPNGNTIAIGAYFNDGGGTNAGQVRVYDYSGTTWNQRGMDLDGTSQVIWFGKSVSMPDENTLAVGASKSLVGGVATGIAQVYEWNGNNWTQKGSNLTGEAQGDEFGHFVEMPDNNTLAVGAWKNSGAAASAGHVRVYTWSGVDWVQKGLDIDGEAYGDFSGCAISMPDENTIAIGAYLNSDGGTYAGQVRVYDWNGSAWVQRGVDLDGQVQSYTGYSVEMPDPNTLAIGANAHDDFDVDAGKLRIYNWTGSSWVQRGSDIDGDQLYANCGFSVSMPNPNTILVSFVNKSTNSLNYNGEVRVYRWDSSVNDWMQTVSVVGTNNYDWLGWYVSMPDDNTIAMGAREGGNGPGYVQVFDICDVNTNVTDNWGILYSSANSATYQWLDCDNNYAPIAGANAQSYLPTTNGSYAVEVTENGCVDTSSCTLVNWVNLEELTSEKMVTVHPNPSDGLVSIQLRETYEDASLTVFSATGAMILHEKIGSKKEHTLNLNNRTGVFIIEIEVAGNRIVRERVIVK